MQTDPGSAGSRKPDRRHPVVEKLRRHLSQRQQQDGTRRQIRLLSRALMIPSVMVVAPLLGYFLGAWAGGYWGRERAGGLVGLVLGLATGVRETVRLVRGVLQELQQQSGPPTPPDRKDPE